ncbi:putative acyl esterase [Crossiella equi]|uniref:Acyl esterase n=1 Tax=Crossiella equi TaxID=130796 RepID=A0ABS5AS56_9PSEU|nr:CocE/NonD family hydrolase [Crossiella equi]MBP2479422.1 putative acyl esterase [Crossiella equi]
MHDQPTRTQASRRTGQAVVTAAAALALAVSGVVAVPASAAPGAPVTHRDNDRVPKGAAWTQHYFPSSDSSGVELHADVLLPENLPQGAKVPVILSIGPYFGHSGQLAAEGWKRTGPSNRFHDLAEGAELFKRGYALVLVDLRGFGGSTGCVDAAGRGDQADVRAAIDWAAKQPWSTGAVGMYGKSFDAITGLIGNNLGQDALKAVVAQEPIWDLYRNIRSYGVPRSTSVSIPDIYHRIATMPQLPDDEARYRANAGYETAHPECMLIQQTGYRTADPESPFWQDRDFANLAKGSDTPLLFTQGMLEWNTEPEAMEEFLANHKGPRRGWLGPWDHVRGNDREADGRLKMGREGWFAETMAFYDEHLKGIKPGTAYPAYAVQDNTGAWRAQERWPVVERTTTVRLGKGSYVDNAAEAGPRPDNSYLQWSKPVERATRITGTPKVELGAIGGGNVMVRLHDVAPDGTAVLFDEQVAQLRRGGTAFELKSTDWTLAKGHSLAVEIGTIQAGLFSDWLPTPSQERVQVTGGTLELSLDDPADDRATPGARAPYLDTYRQISTSKLTVGKPSFTL